MAGRRNAIRVAVLEHLDQHGRTSPDEIARRYLGHVSPGKRSRDTQATVARQAARQTFIRLERFGYVRMYKDESARITKAGRAFLNE